MSRKHKRCAELLHMLQVDVAKLVKSLRKLHISKCEILALGISVIRTPNNSIVYIWGYVTLVCKITQGNDFGVRVSANMKIPEQCGYTAAHGNQNNDRVDQKKYHILRKTTIFTT